MTPLEIVIFIASLIVAFAAIGYVIYWLSMGVYYFLKFVEFIFKIWGISK
jgi:hypothetical protein